MTIASPHNQVTAAIAKGELVRGSCEVCGTTEKVEGHHDDYARPLEVRWLCRPHHREWHKANGPGENRPPADPDIYRVRLDPELYERLRKIAEGNDRHITQEIRRAVRVYVEQVEEGGLR